MSKKKKIKIAAPVKSQKGVEIEYRKKLFGLGKSLVLLIRTQVLPYLKANEQVYTGDGIGSELAMIYSRMNANFSGTIMAAFATNSASAMVQGVIKNNENSFAKSVAKATGVNLSSIIAVEGLEDFTQLSIQENTKLITDLPDKYLKEVQTIINNSIKNGASYRTIEKEILGKTGANGKLLNRVKLIARNEASTINSQLTLKRSKSLGITEGIWRTSEDERVRGNPSGKYPKAKPSHFKLNRQKFNLKKGIKVNGQYILPGIPINCRCTYSPVIEVDA